MSAAPHAHPPSRPHAHTQPHALCGRHLYLITMMAYRVEYPPCEEVHARRMQESAEDMSDLLTAHAHASDAKVARSVFAIRVALHAPALARMRPANVQLLGDVMQAWRGVAKAAAASRAMTVQRAKQRLAQQQRLDEELRRKIVSYRIV